MHGAQVSELERTAFPAVDLDSEKSVAAGLRTFWNIAREWGLSREEQASLLGVEDISVEEWRLKPPQRLERAVLMRISYVLGIYAALQNIFPVHERHERWLRAPNDAPFLNGQCALDRMLSGDSEGLQSIRRYLEVT